MFEHKMTAHGIHSSKDHKILNCSNLLEYPYILNKEFLRYEFSKDISNHEL